MCDTREHTHIICILASGTGKSTRIANLLRNHMHVFEVPLKHLIVVYAVWTPILEALREKNPSGVRVHFTRRVPSLDELSRFIDSPQHKEGSLAVLFEDIQVLSLSRSLTSMSRRTMSETTYAWHSSTLPLSPIISECQPWPHASRQLRAIIETSYSKLEGTRTPIY